MKNAVHISVPGLFGYLEGINGSVIYVLMKHKVQILSFPESSELF